uniref:BEN domain-containing protein n=1 Tax=Haemonchus placei TaxID=6290 RepID=A0A0N4WKS4_HAEPC
LCYHKRTKFFYRLGIMSSLLFVVSKFKGRKRGLIDFGSSQKAVASAVDQSTANDSMPAYMKTIVDYLVDVKERLDVLTSENKGLAEEVQELKDENSRLRCFLSQKSQSDPLVGTNNSSFQASLPSKNGNPISVDCCELEEVSRSLVIIGIPEFGDPLASNRVIHDFDCVRQLFNLLNIECVPLSLYRMGKPAQSCPRLLKAILLAARFNEEAVKLAPTPGLSPFRGTYIQPRFLKLKGISFGL